MPLYDYDCTQCGPFRAWNSMQQSSAAVACPTCAAPSVRIIAAPALNLMNPNTRIAHYRNEKSANEPRVVSREQLDKMEKRPGCGHAHEHHAHEGQAHVHRSNKPWMIGH